MDAQNILEEIQESAGGKENIDSITVNASRLEIHVKNKNFIKETILKQNKAVYAVSENEYGIDLLVGNKLAKELETIYEQMNVDTDKDFLRGIEMGKHAKLAKYIIHHIGGKENIEKVTHCMTRLRFNIYDSSKVNESELLNHKEIITAQQSGGQYQVVIGTHVDDVYKEVIEQLGTENQEKSEESQSERKSMLNRFIEVITKIITPTLGILIGTALILGLHSLLTSLGVIEEGGGAYIILNAMGNALFTFFPIVLGYTSAKAFQSDGFIGMMVGASLVFPEILTDLTTGEPLYLLFSGTFLETPVYNTFFGIPIIFPEFGYVSTVIPVILAMFFISKLERILRKRIPKNMGFTFVPFITLLIGVPVTILVIGPIANFASTGISSGIGFLYGASPVITALIVGFFYTPLVILGLHWPMVTIGINNLATQGFDPLMPMIYTVPFAQMAVVLAVYLRTKMKKTKSLCIPAMISTLFAIIEPAIYGITLPVKKRILICCIGSGVGAVIIALFSVNNFAPTIGLLGIVGFINPSNGDMFGMYIAAIASLATIVISFLLAYVTFKEPTGNDNIVEKKLTD
ncbi:PTS transporter subunit EIIC [Oceanobacillus jeddahense]|uniref:PTS transporter subunit EIIC n=1 Tax=Oceanobacillus jeddahense TaxID=1462527 RepID=UPI00362C6A28